MAAAKLGSQPLPKPYHSKELQSVVELVMGLPDAARLAASGQAAVKCWRDSLAEAGHPQGGEDACNDVHGVVGAQDEDGSDFKEDQHNGTDREPLTMKAREFYCAENRDGGVAGKEKVVGHMIGHQK